MFLFLFFNLVNLLSTVLENNKEEKPGNVTETVQFSYVDII